MNYLLFVTTVTTEFKNLELWLGFSPFLSLFKHNSFVFPVLTGLCLLTDVEAIRS